MKKKILASLVATMAVGATCAFAANPFVDVPTDSWAYKSVVELADAGVIQGVDGSYFQGERNITRYEAAEMVAKAMAHMDKANLEQRATINKLANEYADELNSLGVRVSNLEKRVGNVKMTGDFRLRYRHQKDGFTRDGEDASADAFVENGKTTSDQFQYRARIRANAYVNDDTMVKVGISSNNQSFDNNKVAASANDTTMYIDDAYAAHNFGKNFNVKVGRWDWQPLGNAMGLQYGDVFDGIQGQYVGDKVTLTAGYGQFKEGSGYQGRTLVDVKTGYAELEGKIGQNVGLGIYYNSLSGSVAKLQNLSSILGGYASFKLGQNWNLLGDYQKIRKDGNVDDAALWGAQLKYGAASMAKQGSWDAWVEYINGDLNSSYGSTNSWRLSNVIDNVKSWGAGVDYTVYKNVMFSVMQSFATSQKTTTATGDPDELTRAQFVFAF